MNIRRYYVPDQTVFITQLVKYREPVFANEQYLNLLKEILRNVKELHPFTMVGYVFLPDHFHLIIHPTGESNFSKIMQSLKSNFTKEYKKMLGLSPSQSMRFWQKRFWDHGIRNDRDCENHLHYIHFNPVKHGFVHEPEGWPDSSYLHWVERGLYEKGTGWSEPQGSYWGE